MCCGRQGRAEGRAAGTRVIAEQPPAARAAPPSPRFVSSAGDTAAFPLCFLMSKHRDPQSKHAPSRHTGPGFLHAGFPTTWPPAGKTAGGLAPGAAGPAQQLLLCQIVGSFVLLFIQSVMHVSVRPSIHPSTSFVHLCICSFIYSFTRLAS